MQKSVFSIEDLKRKLEQYCVYQDRCHKEVEQKLSDYHLISEAKTQILLHLLENNFLNEERFAKSFARGKFSIKKWGKVKIVRELKFRDISTYNIQSALNEIDKEEYLNTLYELAVKKNNALSGDNYFKRKQKVINFLQYRGYETDLIYQTVTDVVG